MTTGEIIAMLGVFIAATALFSRIMGKGVAILGSIQVELVKLRGDVKTLTVRVDRIEKQGERHE